MGVAARSLVALLGNYYKKLITCIQKEAGRGMLQIAPQLAEVYPQFAAQGARHWLFRSIRRTELLRATLPPRRQTLVNLGIGGAPKTHQGRSCRKKPCPLYPPKADMCGAARDVR
jgi:hypothetical protein